MLLNYYDWNILPCPWFMYKAKLLKDNTWKVKRIPLRPNEKPKIKKPIIDKAGYRRYRLYRNNKSYDLMEHHIAFVFKTGNWDFKKLKCGERSIDHIDRDKLNNHPDNLEIKTVENQFRNSRRAIIKTVEDVKKVFLITLKSKSKKEVMEKTGYSERVVSSLWYNTRNKDLIDKLLNLYQKVRNHIELNNMIKVN